MQSVVQDNRLPEVRTRLLEEIKATKKRIHRDLHPFVVSSYRWSVPMLQETYDNRDNLERLQYLVWDAGGKAQWDD